MLCQKGSYRIGKAILEYSECRAVLSVLFGNGYNVVCAVEKDGIFIVPLQMGAVVKSTVEGSAIGDNEKIVLVAEEPQFYTVRLYKMKARSRCKGAGRSAGGCPEAGRSAPADGKIRTEGKRRAAEAEGVLEGLSALSRLYGRGLPQGGEPSRHLRRRHVPCGAVQHAGKSVYAVSPRRCDERIRQSGAGGSAW